METPTENIKLEIEQSTLKQLNTARKWAMFLAIIGYIFLGIMIVVGVLAGTFLKTFSSGENNFGISDSLMFIPIILIAAVYFFPVLFLFRFSKYTSKAIKSLDKLIFHKAIKNLKYYFAYIGILLIIVMSLYFIILIIAGSSVAFLKGLG
jgi:magnesium-transporting ATPase (P-type)